MMSERSKLLCKKLLQDNGKFENSKKIWKPDRGFPYTVLKSGSALGSILSGFRSRLEVNLRYVLSHLLHPLKPEIPQRSSRPHHPIPIVNSLKSA